jgi:hypothetical protein
MNMKRKGKQNSWKQKEVEELEFPSKAKKVFTVALNNMSKSKFCFYQKHL